MNVDFFEPPKDQRSGGLDFAIRSLEEFLRRAGIAVRCNPSLTNLQDEKKADVVHFHGLWQPQYLRASARCRRLKIPYVVSPHGMLEPWAWHHKRWKKRIWYRLFEGYHLAGASRLLTTSEAEASNLKRFLPAVDCQSIPLGLTSEQQPDYAAARSTLGWSESEVVLLFLSRIHPKKGLDLLLRALTGLKASAIQKLRLVVVGGGGERYVRHLKTMVHREIARLPRVDWIGEIWDDRKWVYFQGADLFCLPSRSENFGLAILEALQVGTRVLTTDQTPWEFVPSLGAGQIVRPAESAIRSALIEFLANPEWTLQQRETLAAAIRRRFSWDRLGPAYLRFYEEILSNPVVGRTVQ